MMIVMVNASSLMMPACLNRTEHNRTKQSWAGRRSQIYGFCVITLKLCAKNFFSPQYSQHLLLSDCDRAKRLWACKSLVSCSVTLKVSDNNAKTMELSTWFRARWEIESEDIKKSLVSLSLRVQDYRIADLDLLFGLHVFEIWNLLTRVLNKNDHLFYVAFKYNKSALDFAD